MAIIETPAHDVEPAPNRPDGWYLSGLTDMEKAFVIEYPVDFSPTRAALRAGYGKGTNARAASARASELLATPKIAEAILAQLQHMAERANVTRNRVLEEIAAIAFSRIDHYEIDDYGNVSLAKGAPDAAIRAISRIKKKVRHEKDHNDNDVVIYETDIYLWNKNDALNAAMRHLGMFLDKKVSVTGTIEELMRMLNQQRSGGASPAEAEDLLLQGIAEAEQVNG